MEFIKQLLFGLVLLPVGLAVDIFHSKILSVLHIDPDKVSLESVATVMIIIGSIKLGEGWKNIFKPITKFRWFLDKKISQGYKLYNKKSYESLVTRRISVNPPVIALDGTVLSEQMDYSQTDDFRKLYKEWIGQVMAGLLHAYGDEVKKEFNDDLPNSATFNSMSDMRPDLKKDIDYLMKKRKDLKKDMLKAGFDPECLEDYEKLKFK